MSSPKLCLLTEEDVSRVVEIENAMHPDPWPKDAFVRCFGSLFLAWGVRVGHEWVAYLIVDTRSDEWHILNLTTAFEHQHRGYARFLLTQLLTLFIQQQADRIHLEVRVSNTRAISLYESFDFVAVGRRKKYYPAVGSFPVEDAILYTHYKN